MKTSGDERFPDWASVLFAQALPSQAELDDPGPVSAPDERADAGEGALMRTQAVRFTNNRTSAAGRSICR
jgi:hypothetical protein